MQKSSGSRAVKPLIRRSVIAGVPIGCLLLAAIYGVSLTLSRFNVKQPSEIFIHESRFWIQSRTGAYWSWTYGLNDPKPEWDLSMFLPPSWFKRLAWQLDYKLVWNSTDENTVIFGSAFGILGPSLVEYEIINEKDLDPSVLYVATPVLSGGSIRVGHVDVPIQPTWVLIADLAFCVTIASTAWFGVAYLRISRRDKSGLCVKCSYPRCGDVCPECGNHTAAPDAQSV